MKRKSRARYFLRPLLAESPDRGSPVHLQSSLLIVDSLHFHTSWLKVSVYPIRSVPTHRSSIGGVMESRDIEVREEGYAALYSQSPSPPLDIDVSLALLSPFAMANHFILVLLDTVTERESPFSSSSSSSCALLYHSAYQSARCKCFKPIELASAIQ